MYLHVTLNVIVDTWDACAYRTFVSIFILNDWWFLLNIYWTVYRRRKMLITVFVENWISNNFCFKLFFFKINISLVRVEWKKFSFVGIDVFFRFLSFFLFIWKIGIGINRKIDILWKKVWNKSCGELNFL